MREVGAMPVFGARQKRALIGMQGILNLSHYLTNTGEMMGSLIVLFPAAAEKMGLMWPITSGTSTV
jgi:hypothetical protein